MSDSEFWTNAWAEGHTGFHQTTVNPALREHGPLVYQPGTRVLVPLCGKSLDLLWLEDRGCEVVGVELVEQAVMQFHQENDRGAVLEGRKPFTAWKSGRITILEGDFLSATPDILGTFTAWWDRASMVALPPEIRGPYVHVLRALLEPGAVGLVSALDYDPDKMKGPPFAVTEAEVEGRFGGWTVLKRLSRTSVADLSPRMREAGHEWFDHHAWKATVRR